MSLRVCAISGGRADFGLLLSPLRLLQQDRDFALSVVLTGQHLEGDSGGVNDTLRSLGIRTLLVDMKRDGDDPVSISRASGAALSGIAQVLNDEKPDLVIILGDRYEILCAALAANLARLPVAHIAGGDLTFGAFDDAFRHAITAMSHIHFVTNADAGKRVAQLGEDPVHIHVTGSPGLDTILSAPALSRDEFFSLLKLRSVPRSLLVTFHPVTRERDSQAQARELVAALADVADDTAIIVTGSNADPEGDTVDALMQDFARSRSNARYIPSLGIRLYANALRNVDAVVGNSSSGLYEAPSFCVPTVNIGSRQDGRIRASSVMDCGPRRAEIAAAIERAFAIGRQPTVNPYGDGRAGERIVAVLKSIGDPAALIRKRFRDLDS